MVELILKYVDPKCIDIDFASRCAERYNSLCTLLSVTCAEGNLCILKALLKKKPDINKCKHSNESPLFKASKHGHMEVVKCLLSSCADINLRNTWTITIVCSITERTL